MSQSNHYDYFVAPKALSVSLLTEWKTSIESERKSVQKDMLTETGAVAWTERDDWGKNNTVISELVYLKGTPIENESFICKPRRVNYEGESAIIVRGKSNRKEGIEFNKIMGKYSDLLSSLPDFNDWLITKFGCQRASLGGRHESGRGTAMLSTRAGVVGGEIVGIAIPNGQNKANGSDEIVVPKGFEKVTYGAWYDLSNNER